MNLTAVTTIQTILGYITDIINEGITWITSVITMVNANPMLMVFILFSFVGAGIGLVKRILRL